MKKQIGKICLRKWLEKRKNQQMISFLKNETMKKNISSNTFNDRIIVVHIAYNIERYIFIALFGFSLLLSIIQNFLRVRVQKKKFFDVRNVHSINQIGVFVISLCFSLSQIDIIGVFKLIDQYYVRILSGIGFIVIICIYAGASRISFRSQNQNRSKILLVYDVFIALNLSILILSLATSLILLKLFNLKAQTQTIFSLTFILVGIFLAMQISYSYFKLSLHFRKMKNITNDDIKTQKSLKKYRRFVIISDSIILLQFCISIHEYIKYYITHSNEKFGETNISSIYSKTNIPNIILYGFIQFFLMYLTYFSQIKLTFKIEKEDKSSISYKTHVSNTQKIEEKEKVSVILSDKEEINEAKIEIDIK